MLTFIVLACNLNVAIPDEKSPSCREFRQQIYEEHLTPMACMMTSPIQIAKFAEEHPGWQPRRWSCKYDNGSEDI